MSGQKQKIQCHFISNTHWDREWRFSMQRTRHMLVYMMDMLFDIFEKEPGFKHFHLDSQTLPVQDYLEVRPERAEQLRRYVKQGRLHIGPWFCLPDEYCVGGESLIRNLLLGHKIARQYGGVSKTGYSPFSWGQISQMPQIYQGFGIDVTSFYRGVNTLVAPKSEFVWEGPDGTRILASRLARRPRYNVWYVIQRPVYTGREDENSRDVHWHQGGGPMRFIDALGSGLDYQYVHPPFQYLERNLPRRAEQALAEQDPDWTTPHRFWSCGHDSSCPDIREARMIADCAKALGDRARVFHSTVTAWQDGLRKNQREDWPVARGEMHHPYTIGSSSNLFGWVLSARMYLKLDNFRTEQQLTYGAEPLAVFASMLGAPYPQAFLDLAYHWLLQNHGHDCMGACSRDVVHDDMEYRFRQSREISSCVFERAMMDVVGAIDLSRWSKEDVALVVYNPAPFTRTGVMEAFIEIPSEWTAPGFEIVDEKDRPVPVQYCSDGPAPGPVAQSPNDAPNSFTARRFVVRAEFPEVPGMGYRTFRAVPSARPPDLRQPATLLTGPQTMENGLLSVTINANGTLNVLDKRTERLYENQGYFRDSGEVGDPWNHVAPQNDQVFTTLNERASCVLIRDGELETAFRVTLDWSLPEGRGANDKARGSRLVPYRIVNTITLRKGQPWVEIQTEIDNNIQDHWLRVSFPSGMRAATHVQAQGQFDVVSRPIAAPDFSQYDERPQAENAMCSFVDVSEGGAGLAFLNEGLKAYVAHDDPARTVSLTLLRAFPLRMIVTQYMVDYDQTDKGSQCLRKHSFRYAIFPHAGDWAAGGVWQTAERFNLPFRGVQVGPTPHGTEPLSKSFLDIKPAGVHVSAVKRSEDGSGWVVRLFNPLDKTVRASVRFNGGFAASRAVTSPVKRQKAEFALPGTSRARWRRVSRVSLEEAEQEKLAVAKDGWVRVAITRKKIVTLKFRP
jgi:hypothetical protein